MPGYRHVVSLESLSGLPQDRCVNVFHSVAADDSQAILFADEIEDCYSSVLPGQTDGLTEYYGNSISSVAGAHSVFTYRMADIPPRVPFNTQAFSRLAPLAGTISFPREVAACLSFQGTVASGLNMARRRGRVFLGPLNAGSSNADVPSGERMLAPAFIADLVIMGDYLRDTATAEWSVYSPTQDLMTTITNGWVDNAFDTQRRRGSDPTSRTLW